MAGIGSRGSNIPLLSLGCKPLQAVKESTGDVNLTRWGHNAHQMGEQAIAGPWLEGRVGFEPTTPGLKVPGPSAELAVRQDQGPRAGMRNGLALDQASPEHLPEKQEAAHGRPLATYVRCDVTSGLERETGIEPV